MVRMKGGKTGAAGVGVAVAMLFAGAAHAQSTVTLYGIVDAGVTYTNNAKGHALWQFTGGNESGPRWGLIGTEDLGGGLKANFRLENGFNVANGALGQGGRMFGRSAWVGLSGANWGAVTLGRQYNSTQDILGSLQMSSFLAQYSTHPFDNDDINNTFRTNNAVKYVSPTIAGLQANLVYGFSNSTGFANDNSWSAGVTYANGPLNAGAAYARVNHPAVSASGAVASDNYYPASESVFGASLGNAIRQQIWGAGGSYAIGPATLGLLYTGSNFGQATGGALRFNNYEGSLRYMVTPALMAAAGYTYTQVARGSDSGHYHQVSAGVQYLLSKRTDVYVNGFYQKASPGVGQAWIDGTDSASSTTSQVAVVVGIRQKF
ncbi:porin [Burkholderia aenigmatica]|uniref:porin n=1 Tax=Burkholderia aenigmatica TaxID=2015348 RepID=UPI001F39020D|nr:porin [Burkholderia aenigmatica]UKD14489.1 porin [Burkholderia aenigmatica]